MTAAYERYASSADIRHLIAVNEQAGPVPEASGVGLPHIASGDTTAFVSRGQVGIGAAAAVIRILHNVAHPARYSERRCEPIYALLLNAAEAAVLDAAHGRRIELLDQEYPSTRAHVVQ